jgi:uncharacterized protein (TIGR03790 family)
MAKIVTRPRRVASFVCLLFWCGLPVRALEPSQILILVNKDVEISSRVARMYQQLRNIPSANLLRLSLGTNRQMTQEQYWERAAVPIKKYLRANPEIRCILTTSGDPYTVQAPGDKDMFVAFDSELATVLRTESNDVKRGQPNPLFLHRMNSSAITDPRSLTMVYVVRLDGPDLTTITRLVEDAIAVEKTGLQGPVFGDAQGMDDVSGSGIGDASIRAAIDRFAGAGFAATLDMRMETWTEPKGGVGDQAAGAAFYIGWYSLRNFHDIFGKQGLARGSIAWHIASMEAFDLWNPNESGWCVNLMRRGAAVTLGPVREPYISAFPRGDIFVERLLSGATIAESYWLALPHVSWAMVILGDPLYRPFALKPRPALVASAYVSGDSNHVLERGEVSSLRVQLDCVGPAGSGTPALLAIPEPGIGLAAAGGAVTIPALKAGQSAVVRVPSVTAGNDPNGMFRLSLNVQNDGEKTRRIVLEGRLGFSRLTGGLGLKSQMFVSPNGELLISGQPGNSVLIETETLRSQSITPPQGFALAGAEFSPDSSRVALALFDPQQKKGGVIITDNKLGSVQPLPAGTQFLRWLEKDKMLLKSQGRLIRHSMAGGEDHIFDMPSDQNGNVLAGTDVLFSVSHDGKVGFKRSSEPFHEVLQATKATQFLAVANDLSVFGGVDAEKRLWVQRGLIRPPEVVASGVERVVWGPISHRAVVQEANNKSRVYDGRDGSWMNLGSVSAVEWSPDEERLLLLENGEGGAASETYLSLFADGHIQRLCPLNRIGQLAGMVFASDGERAFLMAGLAGKPDVWMVALPPRPVRRK